MSLNKVTAAATAATAAATTIKMKLYYREDYDKIKKEGFTFDIGPTWYWMPDVFEKFFADFDKKPSDYYHLDKLNPAYEVYFDKVDSIKIPDNLIKLIR